jgi:hypothetical protein
MSQAQIKWMQKRLKIAISRRALAIRNDQLREIAGYNAIISQTVYSLASNVWM